MSYVFEIFKCAEVLLIFLFLSLTVRHQLEEGQHRLREYVRGGAYCHQKLPPHQCADVGAGGKIYSHRQARTAQPLQQVRPKTHSVSS